MRLEIMPLRIRKRFIEWPIGTRCRIRSQRIGIIPRLIDIHFARLKHDWILWELRGPIVKWAIPRNKPVGYSSD